VIFFIELFLLLVYITVYFYQFANESRLMLWLQHAVAVTSVALYVMAVCCSWMAVDIVEVFTTGLFVSYIVLLEIASKATAIPLILLYTLYSSGATLYRVSVRVRRKRSTPS
jgi:signal transduction histidine kinase